VADVLDRPVLTRVPVREAIARAVDAGVLGTRMPEPLARAAARLVDRVLRRRADPGERRTRS
jgi:hypothetical protein